MLKAPRNIDEDVKVCILNLYATIFNQNINIVNFNNNSKCLYLKLLCNTIYDQNTRIGNFKISIDNSFLLKNYL